MGRCETCGEQPQFSHGSFASKRCVVCGGHGKPCDSCGVPTPHDELHVWQPPEVIAFACAGGEYHVCVSCLDELPTRK